MFCKQRRKCVCDCSSVSCVVWLCKIADVQPVEKLDFIIFTNVFENATKHNLIMWHISGGSGISALYAQSYSKGQDSEH